MRVTDALTTQEGPVIAWRELARRIEGLSGRVAIRWHVDPRFGYGLAETKIASDRGVPTASDGVTTVAVRSWSTAGSDVRALSGRFELEQGSRALIALVAAHDEPLPVPERDEIERRIDLTCEYWRRWASLCRYDGGWRPAVLRSALTLKLLTSSPSGAIAAAPTTSLPEAIGGEANWDYRYSWVRDASYTLDALLRLDLREEAHRSFTWLLEASAADAPNLKVLYPIDEAAPRKEDQLPLAGYRGSRPVRIGNAAAEQFQLGIYGDFIDTASLYVREGNTLDPATAERIAATADRVCKVWKKKDAGLWEERNRTRHFTESKISSRVALDRAVALAEAGELPREHMQRWRREAERITDYVERKCWSDELGAFAAYAGSKELDAAVLLAWRMGYGDPRSARMASTLTAIRRELARGPLLYRRSGAEATEGAFLACSFWLVEALARSGRVEEAAALMDELVELANDVGLYSEQIDPDSRELLGNFPQGLTHLGLIMAACIVEESQGER